MTVFVSRYATIAWVVITPRFVSDVLAHTWGPIQ